MEKSHYDPFGTKLNMPNLINQSLQDQIAKQPESMNMSNIGHSHQS